jgi:hypothetical protein
MEAELVFAARFKGGLEMPIKLKAIGPSKRLALRLNALRPLRSEVSIEERWLVQRRMEGRT